MAGTNSYMTPEARKAKDEYYRRWRQKNRDKQQQYEAAYWQRKADEAAAAETAKE